MSEVIETKPIEAKATETKVADIKPTEAKSTEIKPTVNVEEVKSGAITELLGTLGIESEDTLKSIVQKAKEAENNNKTEMERTNDLLKETTKQLLAQKEATVLAEAKLSALQLGAKPELVEDLVIVAKSKATDKKDVSAVIAEIKESDAGKVYFVQKEEEKETKTTVTRKRVQQVETKPTEQKQTETNKFEGTFASRILSGVKKQTKSNYFK